MYSLILIYNFKMSILVDSLYLNKDGTPSTHTSRESGLSLADLVGPRSAIGGVLVPVLDGNSEYVEKKVFSEKTRFATTLNLIKCPKRIK